MSIYSKLQIEPADPIIKVMVRSAQDSSPDKVDVTIGVYKDEDGSSLTFPVVKKAKEILHTNDPGHSYTTMQGIPEFNKGARDVVFGEYGKNDNIVTIQTISGTGAIYMATNFLTEAGWKDYYVGNPAWSNYYQTIDFAGGKAHTYTHYDEKAQKIDFDSLLEALNTAPANSIFLLQTCCHNPTGADFSKDQWKTIGELMKKNKLIPILDTAYQGFATGDKYEDAWPVRYFYELNIDFLVCQSFSKNLGLYGERTGALHVVVQDRNLLPNVTSTLLALFRKICSFAPAWGARIAAEVFKSEELTKEWDQNVADVTKRLRTIREKVHQKFVELKTPGDWSPVLVQTGLFWYSGLTEDHIEQLAVHHHVYATTYGRINVSGLNDANIDYFCRAVDTVVRGSAN
ncbi:PLP-dependent transferase [Suhomyces tanzawaensis NRRL Y-17324]|uniref:PLP-dependent transferase n=1 Tax=Suhomyces tanzawaensis NRRL Y-17324 TaxID=984487 RepID=A0A1E4SQF4_9ASCO|nr:PLP-dependent transferase [Suhomyces tanzawaensis NRRL Y-17324]ODV81743.1 PLP-dependent transferase [Suhomyces tanzawaensis NRRL Y-17324]